MAIFNAKNLDIEAEKEDGTVELFIVSSGQFDDSVEQQTLLMDKIENYIGYILSDAFKNNHPNCPKEKSWIVLRLDKEPSVLLIALCGKIHSWVKSYGICFRVEYKSFFGKKHSVEL